MTITIVEQVKDSLDAKLTYPVCPNCGTKGTYGWQESDLVDGFFAIIDVYICPVCHPELLERVGRRVDSGIT